MSENTATDLPWLTRKERLKRLVGPEHPLEIPEEEAPLWRTAIRNLHNEPDNDGLYTVRTSKQDKITRVIKLK